MRVAAIAWVLVLVLGGCASEVPPADDPPEVVGDDDVADDDDSVSPVTAVVLINEVLSDSDGGLEDGDGDRSDWIELYNPGPEDVDLAQWGLSDDQIDYMLIHQYTTNRDGPEIFSHNNMRGVRRREPGAQFRFFVWDMEYSLWEADDFYNIDVDVAGAVSHVYAALRANADFRQRYSDRASVHLFDGGALTYEACLARFEARADEIYNAVVAESARWGDTDREQPYTRDAEWMDEYDRLVDEYFPYRTEILIAQLREAGLLEE